MLDKSEIKRIADNYVNEVLKTLKPKSIILFGSYVNGTPTEDSDIDIAVIFDDFDGDWLETAAFLCSLKRRVSIHIEPHMMDETIDHVGFLGHIKKTGEVIYTA